MRELKYGVKGHANLKTSAMDDPGAGGACHQYLIEHPDPRGMALGFVKFQNGPIQEVGINGIQNEDLMAILIDRLRGFQSGEFPCVENEIAMIYLERAMISLQSRTMKRLARGVEGTLKA